MEDNEINKLVAEKIMGITNLEFSKDWGWLYKEYEQRDRHGWKWVDMPNYCNDLNAAFEAWTHLAKDDVYAYMQFEKSSDDYRITVSTRVTRRSSLSYDT